MLFNDTAGDTITMETDQSMPSGLASCTRAAQECPGIAYGKVRGAALGVHRRSRAPPLHSVAACLIGNGRINGRHKGVDEVRLTNVGRPSAKVSHAGARADA